jgi:hypothetical protein
LTLVGYEQLRRIRDTLSGSLQAPRQQWQVFRQRRLKAKQELPQVFRELLRQHFVEAIGSARGEQEERELADETVECLLQCSGIELEVETFDFAPGAAVECEHMVGTIDKEFAEKFTLIEAQVREREAKVLEFFQKRLELADQGKRDLILQLVEKAPAVLPYLLQSPVGERFIRFFLTLGESAVREKLRQLSSVPANDPNLGRMLTEMMASGADRKDGNGAQGGEPSF